MGQHLRDYRFDILAYGLRKTDHRYAFSTQASRLLAENDESSTHYGDEMWEEFWQELLMEYGDENK